mgnify:CR=1 FL=1
MKSRQKVNKPNSNSLDRVCKLLAVKKPVPKGIETVLLNHLDRHVQNLVSQLPMTTLGCQIDEYTRLFGTKET